MDLLSLLDRVRRPAALEQSAHWFARHTRSIIFLILTLALVGAYVAFTIPIAVFPTTNFPRIVIGVDNGVMPIDQMLVTVTRPLEEAVNTVPGLQQVRSITSRGSAEIDLFFDWDADMIQTLQLVDAAVSRAQSSLPLTARIESHRLTFASFPILGYSLTSDTVPQTQLWELATYEIKPRLNRLDGVSTVIVQGGQEPEFQITPDPAKLLIAKVTVPDLLEAIRRTNLIDSPGLLERNHQLFLALVNGQVRDPAQIADIVVKATPRGIPVRIGDVARVAPSVRPVYTIVTANGKPAVLLNINRQPESNTMAVAEEVHAEVVRIQQSLPPGIHLQPFYDQSTIVGASVESVRDAVLMGLILASILMVLFLRDWGTSIVAGLVIPVTLLITCIAFKLLGQSFNLMTLGGLAAAVGLVIDDAIVVVENIVRHRDAGESGFDAIHVALREITVPLIGSTLTPIVVFLPLISITGVTGTFFRALAITVAVSLCASLALAMSWTPTLSQYLIHPLKPGETPATENDTRFAAVIRFYERWLRHALHHPGQIALLAAGVTLVSFFSYQMLGTNLLPEMDEGGFVIDYVMPAGSSLQETDRVVNHIEKMLRGIPEVEGTSRRTGLQLGLAAVTEANSGDISVKLKSGRRRGIDDIMAEAREKIAQQEPAVSVEFIQTLQDMIGDLTGAPEPIQIKLFSPDAALLRAWAPRVGEAIHKVPGVVDELDGIENTISGPAVSFQVDPMTTARAGFTPEEVSTDAAAILQGEPSPTPVVVNDRAYTIRVRYPEVNRQSLEAMSNTLLNSASGHTATLGSLARLTELPGQTEIRRENLQRMVAVTARLEGRDLGSGVAAVQKVVAGLHLPSGIRVEYGGTYQEQQRSFHDLLLVLLLAVVCVFLVLLFEFRTFRAPLAILASTLLSTSGVFLALLVTRTEFNVCSFMGLIMVVGIVAKNGILLLDAEQQFRAQGLSPEESIVQAGRRRLRPIVMTALATVAGMLPLALAWGAGSQMLQPLAIAVIGGILISMVLSLLVTPAVQFYLSRRVVEGS
jgi:CzcA family heavy metal efflux pump